MPNDTIPTLATIKNRAPVSSYPEPGIPREDELDAHHDALTHSILARHSTRIFVPKPVPDELLQSALRLAQHAPSNSNTQPWRVYFLRGAARARLVSALLAAVADGAPNIPPLPQQFTHYRSEMGRQIYGEEGYGIPRNDNTARRKAVLRNYEFFRAPVAGIVCMHRELGAADAMSVGMYIQTLLLALTEHGLGSCVQVSVAGYPEVVRKIVGFDENMVMLCGLAIGYEDEAQKVNKLVMARDDVEKSVYFIDE